MATGPQGTSDSPRLNAKLSPREHKGISTPSQKEHRNLAKAVLRYCFYDAWYSELVAVLLSSASLVAIAVVAHTYNGKPVPALPRGITLNAINSILATTFKSALIFCVASNISQWKWIFYREEKQQRLGDLQSFDDASRGPLGALIFCTSRTRTSLGAIGALIILLATMSDPFIQQLLGYPTIPTFVPSNLTWTREAHAFPGSGPSYRYDKPFPSVAFEEALWSNNSAPFARQPICASTNCTWDSFSSLGFCARCADVSKTAVMRDCDVRPESFEGWSTYNKTLPDFTGPVLSKTCDIVFDSDLAIPVTLSTYLVGSGYWFLNFPQYAVAEIYGYTPGVYYRQGGITPTPNKTLLGHRNPLVALGAQLLVSQKAG